MALAAPLQVKSQAINEVHGLPGLEFMSLAI